MTQATGLSPKARVRAYAFAAVCTGLGWAGAIVGHQAETAAVRAALILAVVACGIAVLFTSFMLREMSARAATAELPLYDWRTLPFWLAITPMASLFVFGVSALGVGAALAATLVAPVQDVGALLTQHFAREARRDRDFQRLRPTMLERKGDRKPSGED